jgi:hypothetical protein
MIVYQAKNRINNKKYIGRTIKTLDFRKKAHINRVNSNKDDCKIFYEAIRKYGQDNFEWTVLKECSTEQELDHFEEFYIKLYSSNTSHYGYNQTAGGQNKSTSRAVIDLETELIYPSATAAAYELGLDNGKISSVCRGDRATTGNKRFRYLDKIDVVVKLKKKTKRVRNNSTGKLFDSCAKASKYYFPDKNQRQLAYTFKNRKTNIIQYKGYEFEMLD